MKLYVLVKDYRGNDLTYRVAEPTEILDAVKTQFRLRNGQVLESPSNSKNYLIANYGARESEVFGCLWLSNTHALLGTQELFQGTIDGASVHPREVVKAALKANAAAVILFHNHPSGNAEASTADKAITKRLQAALQLIDIRVLDHLIVAGDTVVSFAEKGIL
ncbi:MAG: RadC family protein [Rhabdochlamydiaceae bacterium]